MRQIAKRLYRILTFWLAARHRERRSLRTIRESGLFDAEFYCDCYPDVLDGSDDPLRHYLRHGAVEGRNPHPLFDTRYYLDRNPDIARSGRNPLEHFIKHGWAEGRNPSPACDLRTHLARNPSLLATGVGSFSDLLGRAATGRPEPVFSASESPAQERAARERPAPQRISVARIDPPANGNRSASPGRAEESSAGADDPVVVVVAHVCPSSPRQGNEYRIHRYLRWLESRGYQTLFVCCPLPGEELDLHDLADAAGELENFIYCDRQGVVRVSLAEHLDHIVAGLDKTRALPLSAVEARRCATEVELSPELAENELLFCPDVLLRVLLHIDARLPELTSYIPNYVLSTRYLPLLKASRLKILDAHDVFSTKAEKVSAFGVENLLEISSAEERALLLRADVVMAIQPVEARELESLVPERPVIDIGVDFDTAPDENASLPAASAPQRVLLVASSNAMNVKGLADFLTYVWPLVLREHPAAELLVGGAVSKFVPEGSPNVIALGYVDSLEELYRGSRLVVNPTVAGTGLKIKTLESLAHWRPLVTWPTGVDGLAQELRQLCLVVTDLYEFYLVIAKALSASPAEAYSEDERRLIRYSLSGLFVYRELERVLGEFVSPRESRESGFS